MLEHIVIERDPDSHVAVVTLNRPPVNALATQTYVDLAKAFSSFDDDWDTRVILFRSGCERAFCAGADIKETRNIDAKTDDFRQRAISRLGQVMLNVPQPIIAVIDGPALGAGCLLATLCDIRYASQRATFGLPEINVGRIGGGRHVMRLIPPGKVRQLYFTGEPISAAEAYRIGLVDELIEGTTEDLEAAARELALKIASKSPIALRMAKEALNLAEEMPLVSGHRVEQQFGLRMLHTEDAREAAAAFVEKREPRWQGR